MVKKSLKSNENNDMLHKFNYDEYCVAERLNTNNV